MKEKEHILVKDVMRKITPVGRGATLQEVAHIMIQEATPLVAVVEEGKVEGIIYIQDLLDPFIPEYFEYLDDFQYLRTFGNLDTRIFSGPMSLLFLADDIMRLKFKSVSPEDSILKAMFYMYKDRITGMVVVSNEIYEGVVSRFDLVGKLYECDSD